MIHKKIEIKARGMEAVGNLYTYFLDSSIEMRPNEKRPVILMCPGGGYEMTSDREAEPMAMQFPCYGLPCCHFALQCQSGALSGGIAAGSRKCIISEKSCRRIPY